MRTPSVSSRKRREAAPDESGELEGPRSTLAKNDAIIATVMNGDVAHAELAGAGALVPIRSRP